MKIGVFSDVHGNLEALNACLARLEKEQAEQFICCGDLVGYGPDPDVCVKRVLQLPLLACVMGNHDAALSQPDLEAFFNYDAKVALDKSKKLLSASSLRALSELAIRVQEPNFCVVHGTPSDPVKEYFSSETQFYANYHLWEGALCFVGHTHLPFYMKGTPKNCQIVLNTRPDFTLPLSKQSRYIINPGAVGKPRDKNPQASFGIWDTKDNSFRFLREPYDVQTTQLKMRRLKFPAFLIDSLSVGY